jgi:two-component system OmpR family sensor kinase
LAKSSLKPLKESIETLDKFAKDLIHDLNTPITAMKLNIKLLEKDPQIKNIKAIERLNKSINTVTELHENLTVLLEKRTFQIISVNIFDIVREVVHLHEPSYPNITFDISKNSLIIDTNPNALKEVLHNIISNACKYNSHNGYVRVYEENKILHIRNSGAEINETNKIFNRNYSEQNSSGIGLDIVKRLCDAMNIKIEVTSDEESNCFSLIFDK